jgi:hypothetical protein
MQEEKLSKHADTAQGMVKAAVLKKDSMSSNLVIALCYDQKPFYMISSNCEKVSWEPVKKKVWLLSLNPEVKCRLHVSLLVPVE